MVAVTSDTSENPQNWSFLSNGRPCRTQLPGGFYQTRMELSQGPSEFLSLPFFFCQGCSKCRPCPNFSFYNPRILTLVQAFGREPGKNRLDFEICGEIVAEKTALIFCCGVIFRG